MEKCNWHVVCLDSGYDALLSIIGLELDIGHVRVSTAFSAWTATDLTWYSR